jgi:hypothetical protein
MSPGECARIVAGLPETPLRGYAMRVASIIRCPHCFMDVLPLPNGLCPACKGDPRFVDVAKRDLVPAEFVDGENLPHICCVCGQPSTSEVECGLKNEPPGPDKAGIMARVLGALGGGLLVSHGPTDVQRAFALSVKLPLCARHADVEPPKPLHIDRKAYRLTFAVHRALEESRLKPRR